MCGDPVQIRHADRKGGYTLTELLVVVTILIMLVAVTLPVARKVMDSNRTREASRMLQAYFAMAKARAVQTGRPCGLSFTVGVPLGAPDPTSRHATKFSLVETPPRFSLGPYIQGTIVKSGGAHYLAVLNPSALNAMDPEQRKSLILRFMDVEMNTFKSKLREYETFLVRFDFKDPWYFFIYEPNQNLLYDSEARRTFPAFIYIGPADDSAVTRPPGFDSTEITSVTPIEIQRAPKRVGSDVELPRGTCIDMTFSGVGPTHFFPWPVWTYPQERDFSILFRPDGTISEMYLNYTRIGPPTGSLFLLLGKVEKAGGRKMYADREQSNLADPESLWLMVTRGIGQVVTTENLPPATTPSPPLEEYLGEYLTQARQAALAGQQMSGQ